MPSEDAREIAAQVRSDVEGRLGKYFAPVDDEPTGFQAVETFGDDGIVEGSTDNGGTFTFVRWRWRGRHLEPVPDRLGGMDLVAPTGNAVEVEGLTAVEARRDGQFVARWFVDWLGVYAQLGVIIAGRPIRMANVEVRGLEDLPDDAAARATRTSRRPSARAPARAKTAKTAKAAKKATGAKKAAKKAKTAKTAKKGTKRGRS